MRREASRKPHALYLGRGHTAGNPHPPEAGRLRSPRSVKMARNCGGILALVLEAAFIIGPTVYLSSVRGQPFADTACGICPTAANESGAVGNFPRTNLGITTSPTCNPPLTRTGFTVEGVTGQDDEREFLVSLGLESNRGNRSRPTPYHDKVTLFVGMEGHRGTGDVWAINPVLTQAPNSGEYDAQGIELDFNNRNGHRGEADAGAGLAGPVSYGLSVTGAAQYRSTSAILVAGGPARIWNRGITFANDCVRQSSFQDLGNPDKSVDIRGNPGYGVYQSSMKSSNCFAGKTGVGPGTESPTAALHVGGDVHCDGRLIQRSSPGGEEAVHRAAVLSATADSSSVVGPSGGACVDLPPGSVPQGPNAAPASVQLTPMGVAMPSLHVQSPGVTAAGANIVGRCCVHGGAPDHQVSWTVTARL